MAIGAGGAGLYLAGEFSSAGAQNELRGSLIRLNPNGSIDKSFDPDVDGPVDAISLAGDELIIGGEFAHVHGTLRVGLAKVNAENGALDSTWNVPINGLGVYALARSGNDLYVGGQFTQVGVTPVNRSNIAKIAVPSHSVDPSWDPNAVGGAVRALALSGNDLFVGGSFFDIDSSGIDHLAKVATTGTGDAVTTWNPALHGDVNALALDGTSLYAGGFFNGRALKLPTGGSGNPDSAWAPLPNG